tara:strand:- start:107 stop:367 length:261 start_codon:yes stop_codon:yes gene_type:complete
VPHRPGSREALTAYPLSPPDFEYGEAYPGSVVPIVTNFAPRMWVPASFGLVPNWAKDAKIAYSKQTGQPFHVKLDTHSTPNWTVGA